jgi:hypothetical protein
MRSTPSCFAHFDEIEHIVCEIEKEESRSRLQLFDLNACVQVF